MSPQSAPLEALAEVPNGHQPHMASRPEADQIGSPASLSINGYPNMHGYKPSLNPHIMNGNAQHSTFNAEQGPLPGPYPDPLYAMQTQSPTHYPGILQEVSV